MSRIEDEIEETQNILDRISSLYRTKCMAVIAKPDGEVGDVSGQAEFGGDRTVSIALH